MQHDLAEQMSGMQKDLHEEFLQKISDMIQRDHVTASHEFRSIRTQLSETLESAGQPKETIDQLQSTVNGLKDSLELMRCDRMRACHAMPCHAMVVTDVYLFAEKIWRLSANQRLQMVETLI